jgi:hypothetical protein
VQEASVALEEVSHSLNRADELSEAEEICESLECEGINSKLDTQRSASSVSAVELAINGVEATFDNLEMEVL